MKYTKSHLDINPKAITPMGPFPDVEDYVEQTWGSLKPGGVKLPAVLEYQMEKLGGKESSHSLQAK